MHSSFEKWECSVGRCAVWQVYGLGWLQCGWVAVWVACSMGKWLCGRFGVEKLLCREIAAWESRGMGESWHGGVALWGFCVVMWGSF